MASQPRSVCDLDLGDHVAADARRHGARLLRSIYGALSDDPALAEGAAGLMCFRCGADLGYYARARNPHARSARSPLATAVSSTPGRGRALPGIGPYTAGAIRSIAFGQRAPILDGNVTRVLSRFLCHPCRPEQAPAKRLYWRLAEELLPAELDASDAAAPTMSATSIQGAHGAGATVAPRIGGLPALPAVQ